MKWSTSTIAAAMKPTSTSNFCSSVANRSWNFIARIRAHRAPTMACVRLSQRHLKSSYCFTMSTITSPRRHVVPRMTGSASCLMLNHEAVWRYITTATHNEKQLYNSYLFVLLCCFDWYDNLLFLFFFFLMRKLSMSFLWANIFADFFSAMALLAYYSFFIFLNLICHVGLFWPSQF